MSKNYKHPETLVARADGYLDLQSGGVVPPVQSSTTYARDENYALINAHNTYGRDQNDQVRLAETIICKLERGAQSRLFASGMAAIAALLSFLKPGETLLLQSGCYWGTTAFIRQHCEHYGIALVEADVCDTVGFVSEVERINPSLVLVETPSNPWLAIVDVGALAKVSQRIGAILAVDATAATPILMRPIEMGADIVIHSATKALNGHSDVLAGVLTCVDEDAPVWQAVSGHRVRAGAILSAQAAWMLIRGMRTLALRVERMCANALTLAEYLEAHEKIEAVWYPGLQMHPAHRLASEQMEGGYGYLLSFLVKGGRQEALKFCHHLEGIHRATSLGGVESLVEHRHTIEGDMTGCPENLIRLSAGIENIQDLKMEIEQALQNI